MWKRGAVVLLVLAFLSWHPLTRPVMWMLLPLGYKPDDLLALLLIGAGLLYFTNIWTKLPSIFNKKDHTNE